MARQADSPRERRPMDTLTEGYFRGFFLAAAFGCLDVNASRATLTSSPTLAFFLRENRFRIVRWAASSLTETWRCGSRAISQASKSNSSRASRTTSLAVFRDCRLRQPSIFPTRDTGKSNVSGAEAEREGIARGEGVRSGRPVRSDRRHRSQSGRNEILSLSD